MKISMTRRESTRPAIWACVSCRDGCSDEGHVEGVDGGSLTGMVVVERKWLNGWLSGS